MPVHMWFTLSSDISPVVVSVKDLSYSQPQITGKMSSVIPVHVFQVLLVICSGIHSSTECLLVCVFVCVV